MRYHCTPTRTVNMKQSSHAQRWLDVQPQGLSCTAGRPLRKAVGGGFWREWTYTFHTRQQFHPIFTQEERMSTHTSTRSPGSDVQRSINHHSQNQRPTAHPLVNELTYGVCPNVQRCSARTKHLRYTQPRGWIQSMHRGKSAGHQKARDVRSRTNEILERQKPNSSDRKAKRTFAWARGVLGMNERPASRSWRWTGHPLLKTQPVVLKMGPFCCMESIPPSKDFTCADEYLKMSPSALRHHGPGFCVTPGSWGPVPSTQQTVLEPHSFTSTNRTSHRLSPTLPGTGDLRLWMLLTMQGKV